MRKSEGQRIPEKEIANFRFVELQVNHLYSTTREKSPVVFLCPEGGGFHDPGALFAQQHQKHPHKREEKFVISFIIFPNTLFGDKMILSMIMMSVTPMRAMFG